MVYLIPTPIGNIDDISVRSLKLLTEIQVLFCEDTRVTKKLLNLLSSRHNIKFKIQRYISFHSHNDKKVLSSLSKDFFVCNIAFMSDAGMPCVSDPGANLVEYCQDKKIQYEVLPGANAALLAYASSGFDSSRFTFYGFLPHKGKEREKSLGEVVNLTNPAIIYEAPHRIEKLALELATICPQRKLFAIKEATKKFEKKFFSKSSDFPDFLNSINTKGEWALVLDPKEQEKGEKIDETDIKNLDIHPKQKAKLLSKLSGKSIKECYNMLCEK
ncbi:MAG: 16S rRNA (cytidine(1402)-2'-O)-methyltransferase [Sulfurospirillum sp.]